MSFLESKDVCDKADLLKIEYEKSIAEYNKAVQDNPDFKRKLEVLSRVQKKLGEVSKGCPYKMRKWNDEAEFSSLKQLFLEAGNIYLTTRFNFNNNGISLARVEKSEKQINELVEKIILMPEFNKSDKLLNDKKISHDAAFD
jgi:hypothetical protein